MARGVFHYSIALITAALGCVVLLRALGAFGPIAASADGPAWLGVVFGLIFVAAGACVFLKVLYGAIDSNQSELPAGVPISVRAFYNGLGFCIIAGLGSLFAWIAFGPGERHFSGSGAFLGPIVGRAMFGFGAGLCLLMLLWSARRWIKRRQK